VDDSTEELTMDSQPVRAMGGSCLGSLLGWLLGLFLGGIAGSLWGWSHAPADLRPGAGLIDDINTVVRWVSVLIGTISGGLMGIVAGAVCGAGLATRNPRDTASNPSSDPPPGKGIPSDRTLD
jgi:hypothetical protein